MSTYGTFIESALKSEFTHVKTIKNEDYSKIDLYVHNSTANRLVKICSTNRNDHIFRKLRGVDCEYLPTVYDVCSNDDRLLILESFVDGKTLAEILQSREIDVNTAISYVCDVCKALDFLHKNNIIHRDVKPSNIIITPQNKAVLIDFSAARIMNDSLDKDTANLGTVGYAAPEQFGIFQSSPPTDIYAVGVLLNEMLIKEHPSVRTPNGKLGKIIKKCTDTQISNRYQNVTGLLSDLKRYK